MKSYIPMLQLEEAWDWNNKMNEQVYETISSCSLIQWGMEYISKSFFFQEAQNLED